MSVYLEMFSQLFDPGPNPHHQESRCRHPGWTQIRYGWNFSAQIALRLRPFLEVQAIGALSLRLVWDRLNHSS